MLFPKHYLPINWADGMKLSQQHFVETDNHVQDLVRDATSLFLTSYNYGLLPPVRGSAVSHEFDLLEKNSNHVEVRLYRCNAITQGGCRIAINPDVLKFTVLTASFAVSQQHEQQQRPDYDIVLVVNPFEKVPIGNPDPDESPLRHPYTEYAYQLMVVPSQQVNADELGSHHLVIGKAVYQEGHYVVDSQYIPPCASVASHPRLIQYYKAFGWGLNELQVSSFKIIRKIHDQSQPSDVARHVQMLCTNAGLSGHGLFPFPESRPSALARLSGRLLRQPDQYHLHGAVLPAYPAERRTAALFLRMDGRNARAVRGIAAAPARTRLQSPPDWRVDDDGRAVSERVYQIVEQAQYARIYRAAERYDSGA